MFVGFVLVVWFLGGFVFFCLITFGSFGCCVVVFLVDVFLVVLCWFGFFFCVGGWCRMGWIGGELVWLLRCVVGFL